MHHKSPKRHLDDIISAHTFTLRQTRDYEGEKDKDTRYGREVMPMAFETYGRLGHQSLVASDEIVASARTFGKATPRAQRRLRFAMERQILFSTADGYLQSISNSSKWPDVLSAVSAVPAA